MEVVKTTQEWLGTPVPVSAQLCLLGDSSVLPQISKSAFALALALHVLSIVEIMLCSVCAVIISVFVGGMSITSFFVVSLSLSFVDKKRKKN